MKFILVFALGFSSSKCLTIGNSHNGFQKRMNGPLDCVNFEFIQPIFAKRESGESYKQILNRRRRSLDIDNNFKSTQTPWDLHVPLEELNLTEIPELESYSILQHQFNYTRDTRFLYPIGESPRRISWLYPDDGCFTRTEIATREIISTNFVKPKKIFALGDLSIITDNSPAGIIYWFWHVVPIYRVGQVGYALDPAVNPESPMTLKEWNHSIGGDSANVGYAICSHDTFTADDDCVTPCPTPQDLTDLLQNAYLDKEWNRILELGRSPLDELGENPPWRS